MFFFVKFRHRVYDLKVKIPKKMTATPILPPEVAMAIIVAPFVCIYIIIERLSWVGYDKDNGIWNPFKPGTVRANLFRQFAESVPNKHINKVCYRRELTGSPFAYNTRQEIWFWTWTYHVKMSQQKQDGSLLRPFDRLCRTMRGSHVSSLIIDGPDVAHAAACLQAIDACRISVADPEKEGGADRSNSLAQNFFADDTRCVIGGVVTTVKIHRRARYFFEQDPKDGKYEGNLTLTFDPPCAIPILRDLPAPSRKEMDDGDTKIE